MYRSVFKGLFLCERICLEDLTVSNELSEALTEGITALSKREEVTTAAHIIHKCQEAQSTSVTFHRCCLSDQTFTVPR